MAKARLLVMLAPIAACSLVTDLGGLSADAGSDVTVSDSATHDVTSDTVLPTDTGCPDHPSAVVCDTFDDVALLGGWSSESVSDGGTLTISDAHWWSPPGSLLAALPAYDAAYNFEATSSLVRVLPAPLTRVRSMFDLYIDAFGDHAAAIGGVYIANGSRSYGLTVFTHSTSTAIFEDGAMDMPDGGSSAVGHTFPALTGQTWTRIILEVDFVGSDGGGPSYTLTVQSPPDIPASPFAPVPITVSLPAASSEFVAGINWAFPLSTSAWRIYVDNVIVEPF